MLEIIALILCICLLLYALRYVGAITVVIAMLYQIIIHWKLLLILLIGIFIFLILIAILTDWIKYKDETPEEKLERLKTQTMIENWRKQFNKKH